MKTKLLLLVFFSLLVEGCANALRFKVVETSNGTPIAGVQTTWLEGRSLYYLRLQTNLVSLPVTGNDGTVIVESIKARHYRHLFRFSKPGYIPAEVSLKDETLTFLSGHKAVTNHSEITNVFSLPEIIVELFPKAEAK